MRNYTDPIITITEKGWQEIDSNGALKAHESWIPELKVIAGSIGIEPYKDINSRPRKILRILPNVPVEPRFTGHDKSFHGIIVVKKEKLILGQDIEYLE